MSDIIYRGSNLEQKCIQPGHWLIEGRDVYHRRGRRAEKWNSEWYIKNTPVVMRTLEEIRDHIRGEKER